MIAILQNRRNTLRGHQKMKIGIISDTHGSVTSWRDAAAKFFTAVELVLHCGDVLYHGPRNPLPDGYQPAMLAQEINAFPKPLICVQGNCDAEVDQLLLEIPLQTPYAQVFTPVWRILIHHGQRFTPETAPVWTSRFNLIISGHTHLPELVRRGETVWLNPGSPALPKTAAKIPTIALIDGPVIQLVNLKTGEIINELRHK
jgi:putative phosphoesterase